MATPAPATTSAGIPVELGKVERELKKLWEQGGEQMCRASLINLAVYSEAPGSLARNTELVAEITEDHACRAIVIAADPSAADERVEAFINAHCHVTRAGNRQICSEQLSFSLAGPSARLLPNIVFSHLDSDLPLHLWWQGEFHDPMDAQLWSWVDRLIYDSRDWADFDAQLRLVEAAQEKAKQRVVLCDLNWTRLVQFRLALAQFFDAPAGQQQLSKIERVEIEFAHGHRSTALLLAGWLAAQLRWEVGAGRKDGELEFRRSAGETVGVALQEVAGASISRCSFICDDVEFRVTRGAGADLLEATVLASGTEKMQQLMPAGDDDPAQLMNEELMRGGPHRVYLRALNVLRELF